ncbi:MAG: AmmeMemoRadiSam system protein B [Candidatus Gracilibacteria bacterium]
MARLKIISIFGGIISVLIMGTLTVYSAINTQSQDSQEPTIQGIILPHHLLVEKYIDEFYKLTAENRPDIKRIILLSPNHFLYGFDPIQSTDKAFTPKNSPKLDTNFIKFLSKNTPLRIESKNFEKEHGIMVELPFIKKYFPKAKVVPITLKNKISQLHLDKLVKEISKQNLSNTLIIASIDFTHYEPESVALKNDNAIITWLKTWQEKDQKDAFTAIKNLAKSGAALTRSAVAIDSPESFYVMVKLMENLKTKNMTLWKRTSSASLLNNTDPLQNTSHLFIKFENGQTIEIKK